MGDISRLRKRIDELDEAILDTLSERAETCRLIGELKKKQKIPIKDMPRENDVYKHIQKKASALGLDPAQVKEVYRQIVNICSTVQELEEKQDK